jgi:hypothetical protein
MSKEINNKNEAKQFVLYTTDTGDVKLEVFLQDENIWLSQKMMAELFDVEVNTINYHIKEIFESKELTEDSVVRKIRITASDGKAYLTNFYNLDLIIAVGYRVNSKRATQFRVWASKVLKEYIIKGFAINDERLKQGGNRYFRELLQRIRDIRSSERNFYQQITDVYASAIDYDPGKEITKTFFATVQNKMHFAVHKNTAAELIHDRVDNLKPFVGMTSFKHDYVTKDDVKIAKNYLSEDELNKLNLLSSQFLDFAELQSMSQNAMSMSDWAEYLDKQLELLRMEVLLGAGKVSHSQALKKAEKEFETYRAREMKLLKSDFDKAAKALLVSSKSKKLK